VKKNRGLIGAAIGALLAFVVVWTVLSLIF